MESDEIVINPHVKIFPAIGDNIASTRDLGSIDGLIVRVPLRGRPLSKHTIKKATDSELFDLFYGMLAASGDLELDLTDAQEEYLLRIGFLAPKRLIPEAVRYSCFLDALELADLSVRAPPPPSDRLIVNPSLRFVDIRAAFEPLRDRSIAADRFLAGHTMLWVEDLRTSVLSPYWVRGRVIDVAASLIPGEPAPSSLDPETESCLRAADILVLEGELERRATEAARAKDEARSQHAERRYAILRDVIPPLHIAAMQRYYRRLVENGHLRLGDSQVGRRYGEHNEAMSSFWHRQLGSLVSHVVGRPVKPSYAYFAQYESGSVLKRHTDRIQAEYTLSIQAAYEPLLEPGEKSPWPIFVDNGPITAAIQLGIGEGVLYRGYELPHYRDELPSGNRSTSLLFHYVHAEFEGSLR